MPDKRKRPDTDTPPRPRALKRSRHTAAPDFLSPLSDELLIWKRLYYSRFVLPRALRLPGFRNGSARDGKLHYSSRRAIWADGRRGGWVDMHSAAGGDEDSRNWKSQYKLRHNWARGKCAVEELPLGDELEPLDASDSPKILVKVLEGIAVTGDATTGLRAWDLKTKQLIAQIPLDGNDCSALPSCMALDGQLLQQKSLDVAVGFTDGSFGTWQLDLEQKRIVQRYRHESSSNGEIIDVAFLYPYLLTATRSILISLYTFDVPHLSRNTPTNASSHVQIKNHSQSMAKANRRIQEVSNNEATAGTKIPGTSGTKHNTSKKEASAPYLLTSLKSHTSRAPLALSLRQMTGSTVASIAYTFSTISGWSLGIQELHIRPVKPRLESCPEITTTQLAYTTPVHGSSRDMDLPPSSPPSQMRSSIASAGQHERLSGPISLSYTHPYLLATLPDNTLILHLCTSSSSALSISPGIRLWGHTSGISDAEITARGKAVSVSCRGEEIRVWELEGRTNGRSIEVRPNAKTIGEDSTTQHISPEHLNPEWGERRNWVGFDDEMVIVLKESKGRESLLVYDFT
ncbi:hypothetical protein NPX13_g3296 [Xylaria arbuscula]|uniref:F-box domain-containing protein n=1 Tax=Xylaria arbuscula TaxID=114810 RepID=A0A9W8TPN5_9PEZI|nr:hypothetical protein NPX13_g3296 [Xylaria arbuscula]